MGNQATINKNHNRILAIKSYILRYEVTKLTQLKDEVRGSGLLYTILSEKGIIFFEKGQYHWDEKIPVSITLAKTITEAINKKNSKGRISKKNLPARALELFEIIPNDEEFEARFFVDNPKMAHNPIPKATIYGYLRMLVKAKMLEQPKYGHYKKIVKGVQKEKTLEELKEENPLLYNVPKMSPPPKIVRVDCIKGKCYGTPIQKRFYDELPSSFVYRFAIELGEEIGISSDERAEAIELYIKDGILFKIKSTATSNHFPVYTKVKQNKGEPMPPMKLKKGDYIEQCNNEKSLSIERAEAIKKTRPRVSFSMFWGLIKYTKW